MRWHLMAMLKCFVHDADVDYNELAQKLNMTPRSAQVAWTRFKYKYNLMSGDRMRVHPPAGRELQFLRQVMACMVEVPKIDYPAMSLVANVACSTARNYVCKFKKNYF
ncbi:hypothetical protein E0Z10_g7705 [Xylaria hypoxylon]|uniref:Uncharacterized protein n=1 Tax=Xylaria hypoxylon TaxID=37992 RepID=A0A4Z0YAX0_9PEZI|nr:hypothetical protein E0Z10_g7705 [Xylaria hypoxylon]